MNRASLLLLLGAPASLLAGCSEYDVTKNSEIPGVFDTGNPVIPPIDSEEDTGVPPEECNGTDDDGDGEVDEGFPDSDGDGYADCIEQDCQVSATAAGAQTIAAECEGSGGVGPVTDPWNAAIEWQYTVTSGSGVIVMPAVGNLTDDNGDGRVDENDTPDVAFSTWTSNTLVALHGDGSGTIFEISGFDGQGGVSIADVDSDGEPEIVAFRTGGKIAAVDGSGNIEWESATFPLMMYPQPTIADLDNAGDVAVRGDVGVVDGATGNTIATLTSPSNSWRTPIAADIDQDGEQEIILANNVYDSRGALLWQNAGNGAGNFSAVAEIDGDNGGEVLFASGSMLYIHDDDGALLTSWTIPGTNPGPICVADFDGDGEPEVAVPANNFISVWDMDGTELWRSNIVDSSGLAGCSGYDVDGDGAYEVLYADQEDLFIYDGASGAVNYVNGSHSSGTVWEYPVIADIDNDGSAEIVIASNGTTWRGITVFGHAGDGWPKSGTTWATHDFGVTNVNPDGSVPSPPEASWLRYNVFRARPSVDDPAGADLTVELIDFCIGTCFSGPAKISYRVGNRGAMDLDAGTPFTIYAPVAGVDIPLYTTTLPALPAGTWLESMEFVTDPAMISEGFSLSIDDDGSGAGTVFECDETNNRIDRLDSICQ